MSVIYLLVLLALVLVGAAVWAFVWAVRRGEMDDLETPAVRMVFDEEPVKSGGESAPACGATKSEPTRCGARRCLMNK